jgi:hypothetical protein
MGAAGGAVKDVLVDELAGLLTDAADGVGGVDAADGSGTSPKVFRQRTDVGGGGFPVEEWMSRRDVPVTKSWQKQSPRVPDGRQQRLDDRLSAAGNRAQRPQ